MRPEPALTGARATKPCRGRHESPPSKISWSASSVPNYICIASLKGLPNLLNVCQC